MPPKVTNADRKRLGAALESFHRNYTSSSAGNWDAERWHNSLYPALLSPTCHAALINHFAPIEALQRALREASISASDIQLFALPELRPGQVPRIQCLIRCADASLETTTPHRIEKQSFPAPRQAQTSDPARNVMTHWNLDAASALAAHMLDVQPGHKVLDLCAAPGGKSLALAQCLFAPDPPPQPPNADAAGQPGCLHVNEFDGLRNKRLAGNLTAYLPPYLLVEKHVRLFKLDGTSATDRQRLPHGKGGYDRVLLDAPCSSERHVIHAQKRVGATGQLSEELARWKPGHARERNIVRTQVALLLGAIEAVKVGGRVVYATCSIERTENDGVIERAFQSADRQKDVERGWKVIIETGHGGSNDALNASLDVLTESTRFGRIALPDRLGKWGPLYFCALTKASL